MENIKQLSKERRNWKGAMSRAINGLQQALESPETNTDIIKDLFAKVSNNYEKIEAAHAKLIDVVEDDDMFDKEERWMEEVQATFIGVRLNTESFEKGQAFQRPMSPNTVSAGAVHVVSEETIPTSVVNEVTHSNLSNNVIADELYSINVLPDASGNDYCSVNSNVGLGNVVPDVSGRESTPVSTSSRLSDFNEIKLALELPKAEFMKFNGNPLNYFSFITNFETVIESKVSCNATRLQHLNTMCQGKARSYIECCDLLGSAGYDEAKKILRTHFGQPFMILSALMRELTDRRPIRCNDSDGLWDLIASMKKCYVTLTKLGYTNDLNSTSNLLRVQDLLPNNLQTSWAKDAHSILSRHGREPKFIDLLNFLVLKAEVSSTMFGMNLAKSKNADNRGQKPAHVRTNNITTDQVSKRLKCFICSGDHQVYVCKEFLDAAYKKRVELATSNRLCFRCLLTGHVISRCRRNWKCRCGSDKHHNLLHPPEDLRINTRAISSGTKVFMRIVPVIVTSSNGRQVSTFALLDDGSDTSLCSEDLMYRLGTRGERHKFTSSTINGVKECEGWSFSLSIKGKYETDEIMLDVLSVNEIPASLESRPSTTEIGRWEHLRSIPWEDQPYQKVELLIAADHPKAFWVEDKRQGNVNDPYAVKTPLGWSVMGPGTQKGSRCNFNRVQVSNMQLLDEVQKSWAVETSGLCEVQDSVEDVRARHIMNSTISKVNGHYEMGLLWRHDDHSLSNNKQMAESRLASLKKRLVVDEELKAKYTSVIESYIEDGYAEPVLNEGKLGNMWYLPHHPVVHPHKKKVRVVYDCAAKFAGTSLNDKLLKGPDLMNDLLGVLLRFREGKIAVVADIKGMFHQVRMREADRDVLRFLWWEKGELSKPFKEYRMCVHLFGATSSPCCSGKALKQTADDCEASNNDDIGRKAIETIRSNFYVDDCLASASNTDIAVNLVKRLTDILRQGGFQLTKWLSNDRAVLATVDEEERAPSLSLSLDELPTERTLGVSWNAESDQFTFQLTPKEKPLTRRGLLSVTSSVFDPLGIASPFVLIARSLLQNVCRRGADWDKPLTEGERKEWQNWLDNVPKLAQVNIPRWLKFDVATGLQLHIFCDASERGYAAVAYLRVSLNDDTTSVEFVLGKARVSPSKPVTIPRLELMAAVLAVTLDNTIRKEGSYSLPETVFWSDSMIVLGYLNNETKRFKTFVANRVSKILSVSSKHQWRHVPTELNPADDGSRGTYDLSKWTTGPDFLKEEEVSWPVTRMSEVSVLDPEVKKTIVVAQASVNNEVNDDDIITNLIGKYSSWTKLLRVMAWILRFIRNLKAKRSNQEKTVGNLLVDELKESETTILSSEQSRLLSNWKSDKGLRQLNVLLMGRLLRVGGRLDNSQLPFDSKHPVLLTGRSNVTQLIVQHHHALVGHSGIAATLTSIRQKYHLQKGRYIIKSFIRDCVICKKINARPVQQIMAPLPAERVAADQPPFTNTGVDYFGPIDVRQRRANVKRYGCIFTCLASRAVHLEVAESLDADSFINAFRRFVARRGQPLKMFSDNGTNFVAGERELRDALRNMNQDIVEDALHTKGCQWHFNPPTASHFGGVWERLIRSVRKVLHGVLRQQTLTTEVFHTLLTEVESILNSRPLTDLSLDPNEEPLTPNHLLLMRNGPDAPVGKVESFGRRRWLQVQYLASLFWSRWKREYLPLLQKRYKWTTPRQNVAVNDIVLLVDEMLPRGRWLMGKVLSVYCSKDDRVRSVDVKVKGGVLKRPVSKLCIVHRGSITNGVTC